VTGIDDWRRSVCVVLRDIGYVWLADEFGGLSEDIVSDYYVAANGDTDLAAVMIINETETRIRQW